MKSYANVFYLNDNYNDYIAPPARRHSLHLTCNLAQAVPQVSNPLYRRFPNRQAVQVSNAPACGAASGFGNPRYSRLGSLRYKKPSRPGRCILKTIDACKVQALPAHGSKSAGTSAHVKVHG